MREWQPDAAVVGLPFNMDDTETEIAPLARRFARQIEGRFGLPVYLVDERLTTLEARQHPGAQGHLPRGGGRHGRETAAGDLAE